LISLTFRWTPIAYDDGDYARRRAVIVKVTLGTSVLIGGGTDRLRTMFFSKTKLMAGALYQFSI
jgi:hypothetical protein